MDEVSIRAVGDYIKDNQYLEILDISRTGITDKSIEVLSDYLVGNNALKELYLNKNEGITGQSIPIIVKIIESSHIGCVRVTTAPKDQVNTLVIPLAQNVMKCELTVLDLSEM